MKKQAKRGSSLCLRLKAESVTQEAREFDRRSLARCCCRVSCTACCSPASVAADVGVVAEREISPNPVKRISQQRRRRQGSGEGRSEQEVRLVLHMRCDPWIQLLAAVSQSVTPVVSLGNRFSSQDNTVHKTIHTRCTHATDKPSEWRRLTACPSQFAYQITLDSNVVSHRSRRLSSSPIQSHCHATAGQRELKEIDMQSAAVLSIFDSSIFPITHTHSKVPVLTC